MNYPSRSEPPVLCIVGKKKSGKTAVVVSLVAELARRGRRVMTVKHGHGFRLDTPGTDSWRHRHEGGARRVVMAGPEDFAVVGEWGTEGEPELEELVRRYLADAEIVIAEGFKGSDAPKIDVFRSSAHAVPVYDPRDPGANRFLAVVTDRADFQAAVPVLHLDDPELASRLADLVEAALLR